ncbi:hypothetical protein HMPREF9370_0063 [Neisseria wadsworthii 9715]|uniref:Uncharacterized protein n=1 Tax=Neisseria wadsworthii 9715 TaxID=1030841 RepID=G4CLV4_9NEIS|nr:hypothetical protein HMPREF9370_0063 [Neisseria wadsworthii 9715]
MKSNPYKADAPHKQYLHDNRTRLTLKLPGNLAVMFRMARFRFI